MEKLVKFLWFHAEKSGLLIDHAFAEKVHCDADHSGACAFAVTSLEHPELAVLNGELHILHVAEIILQLVGSGYELCGEVGHGFLECGIFCAALFFADALQSGPAA